MKLFFTFIFLLVSLNVLCQLNVNYLPLVTIDGKDNEWSEDFLVRKFNQKNKSHNYSNTVSVYAAWNEESLYLMVKVDDKHLVSLLKNDQNALYLNDAIEIYIDPKNDSKKTMDVNDYQFIVSVDNKSITLKGDKHLIEDSAYLAPKESGTSTLLFGYSLHINGKINDQLLDKGYLMECSIPFAGIGIKPKEKLQLKLDICIDDADKFIDIRSLGEADEIPFFYYGSWKHSRNFSMPENWETIQLKGNPSQIKAIFKVYFFEIFLTILIVFTLILFITFRLYSKNNQLKSLPQYNELTNKNQRTTQALQEVQTKCEHVFSIEKVATAHPFIQKGREFILDNLDKDISVEEFASHLAMSVRSLQRQMKEEISLAPNHFITIVKMEEAAILLLKKEKNVNEIAFHLGYSDVSYFGKLFKRYYSESPKQYMLNQSNSTY